MKINAKSAKGKSDILATFTFLATFLVVMCHADDVLAFRPTVAAILGGTFSDANVYNFFWLSGFFLGRHLNETCWWRSAIVKRISTLVVPYVLWNVAYFVYDVLMEVPHKTGLRGVDRLFGITLGSMPQCFPLWYIKTLCLFVLAAPVFAWPLMKCRSRTARVLLLLVLIAAYPIAKVFHLPDTPLRIWSLSGFLLLGFVFFCGGLWLSQVKIKESWREAVLSCPRLLAVAAFVVWMLSAVWTHYHRAFFYEVNILLSSVCLFLISCSIRKTPAVFTRNAFFIYGSHIALLGLFGRYPNFVGRHLPGGSDQNLLFLMMTVIVTAIGIAGGEILRRVVPTLYAPLVGGRV